MLANHKENQWIWKGQKFCCLPGQFITSLNTLSFYSGCSEQNIRTALVKFEKLDFLTNETTKDGRLVTIKNWDKYQGVEIEDNKPLNKEVTNDQQRGNKEVTTNKNNKKDKNENNDKEKEATNFNELMNKARKLYKPIEVIFEKGRFRFPNCNITATNERAEWYNEWKPKIEYLNNTLDQINENQ